MSKMADRKGDLNKNKEPQTNMWQEILREAMTKKEIEDANIFIFGDKVTGKKSLIRVISKDLIPKDIEDNKKLLSLDELAPKYGMIDYTYLNVNKLSEKDSESIGKMGVWIVNDTIDKDTFVSLIKPEYITKCICLIFVDLSRPSTIKESLNKWTNFIYDNFSNLILKFPLDKQQELRQNVINNIKLYQEPEFDEEGNLKKEILTEEQKQIKLEVPLKEGVLKTNCGVPLMFVVNKSDVVSQIGEKKFFEENSEFILKHIRQIALLYGASIIYTSGKGNNNLEVLYNYICHTLFNFELPHKPNLIDKDCYFIPAGYDSLTALKSMDTQNDLAVLYDERIPQEKMKNYVGEEEIVCEDTNVFLGKLKAEKGVRERGGISGHRTRASDLVGDNRGNTDTTGKFNRFMDSREKKKDDIKKPGEKVEGEKKPEEKAPKSSRTKDEMMKKLQLLKGKKEKK
jgi:dynein light intermediate chain 1